jgi:hypothetical protein
MKRERDRKKFDKTGLIFCKNTVKTRCCCGKVLTLLKKASQHLMLVVFGMLEENSFFGTKDFNGFSHILMS